MRNTQAFTHHFAEFPEEALSGWDVMQPRAEDIGEISDSSLSERGNALIGNRDALVLIRLSPDRLEAWCDCWPARGEGKPLTSNMFATALEGAGVRHGIDWPTIETIINRLDSTNAAQTNLTIARGTPAQHGEDGRIEFHFASASSVSGVTENATDRVDFKNLNRIIQVRKDDCIACILPPETGQEGQTVCGEVLPTTPGMPAELIPGAGVAVSPDGLKLFASIDGHVVRNSSAIEVLEVYVVEGDVDYSTGNIRFKGSVIIEGSVREGFEVHADGDITVQGDVEPSHIQAGRDVLVQGGIRGRAPDKGMVLAGRHIQAEFAQNARLEAQGDITLRNFAMNSNLLSSGTVNLIEKKGALIGGEAQACLGIEARMLGAGTGTPTRVRVGVDFVLQRQVGEVGERIEILRGYLDQIRAALAPIVSAMRRDSATLRGKEDAIRNALEKRAEFEGMLQKLITQRMDLERQIESLPAPRLLVYQVCHPDVQIRMRDSEMVIHKPLERVSFKEDRSAGMIRVYSCRE